MLQRSLALKQNLEQLYRDAVHKRLGALVSRQGWKANDKSMGWGENVRPHGASLRDSLLATLCSLAAVPAAAPTHLFEQHI